MYLGRIIERLEKESQDKVIKNGFNNPHSYRGDYYELGVEPKENTSIKELLTCLKEALDSTYTGWKGGDFTMDRYVDVYIAYEGTCGDNLGGMLLEYMLKDEV